MCLNLSEQCSSQILIVYFFYSQAKFSSGLCLSSSNFKICSTSLPTCILKEPHVQAYTPFFAWKMWAKSQMPLFLLYQGRLLAFVEVIYTVYQCLYWTFLDWFFNRLLFLWKKFGMLLIHLSTFPTSCSLFNTITTLESTVLRENKIATGDPVTTVW